MPDKAPDTPAEIQIDYRALEAFRDIGSDGVRLLKEDSKLLSFRIGQTLTESNTMPTNAYWLLEGECRQGFRAKSDVDFEIGCRGTIGLASLLRAEPCEQVSHH